MSVECPWLDEPDKAEGEHEGMRWVILRMPGSGHLCGYVILPEGHPLVGVDYDDNRLSHISVRGGLTYSSDQLHTVGDVPWCFGFDCAHYGDLTPRQYDDGSWQHDGQYRTMYYVQHEVKALAEQLAAFDEEDAHERT